MSKNDMGNLPEGYMLVERSVWTEQQVDAAAACITLLKDVPGMRDRDLAMAAIDAAQCKAPDISLADILPATHHGEPVALPEHKRETLDGGAGYRGLGNSEGWNACLDEIAKLGPLFTHADPGEVERWKASAEHFTGVSIKAVDEVNSLRAQLSERDELLRDALSSHGTLLMTNPPQDPWKTRRIGERIAAALAGSTQPTERMCTHPEGCTNCSWCGFKSDGATSSGMEKKP